MTAAVFLIAVERVIVEACRIAVEPEQVIVLSAEEIEAEVSAEAGTVSAIVAFRAVPGAETVAASEAVPVALAVPALAKAAVAALPVWVARVAALEVAVVAVAPVEVLVAAAVAVAAAVVDDGGNEL